MQQKIEFLKPSVREIKKSIRGIDESYNNDWDILAELLQNSVDAIKKKKPSNPQIIITVNSLKKSISVEDNGIGINRQDLPILLAPFSTNKEGDEDCIGEKGVGLTFVLFSCDDFYIKTGNTQGSTIGKVYGGYSWKNNNNNDSMELAIKACDDKYLGTLIKLNSIEDNPLFKLSTQQLIYLIRTRTAIGNTLRLWDDTDMNISVTLKHTNLDDKYSETKIPYKFQLIYESLNNHSKISLNDFISFAENAYRTDSEKRIKIQDKVIYDCGSILHKGRSIRYITCFVPKRKVWQDISLKMKLCTESELGDDEWKDSFYYSYFSEGIFTSVKGMPTGISIEHPATGYAGYWSNIFILFEDRHLKFDIGRKSIHGMTAKVYKSHAKKIFNKYLKYITKYVSGDITTISPEWDKDDIFAEIESLIDINSKQTSFTKSPKDQEASVAAIFYESLGRGLITGITPLISGYRNKYDLYAKCGNKKVVFEFKSKLRNILRDFDNEQKMFNEIDCIVCWDVSENDKQAMKDRGLDLEILEPSTLSTNNKSIPHSSHRLALSGYIQPIYIIDLKRIIQP